MAAATVGFVAGCRACGGRLTVTMSRVIWGFNSRPNAFLDSPAGVPGEKRYPLRAEVCESCKLVQVDYDVAPEGILGNYVYFSSYSDDWLNHAKQYCESGAKTIRAALRKPGS